MQEIADTLSEEGGFQIDMFSGATVVFELVSEDTDVGMEKTEARHPGQGPENVARLIREGVETKTLNVE